MLWHNAEHYGEQKTFLYILIIPIIIYYVNVRYKIFSTNNLLPISILIASMSVFPIPKFSVFFIVSQLILTLSYWSIISFTTSGNRLALFNASVFIGILAWLYPYYILLLLWPVALIIFIRMSSLKDFSSILMGYFIASFVSLAYLFINNEIDSIGLVLSDIYSITNINNTFSLPSVQGWRIIVLIVLLIISLIRRTKYFKVYDTRIFSATSIFAVLLVIVYIVTSSRLNYIAMPMSIAISYFYSKFMIKSKSGLTSLIFFIVFFIDVLILI